VLGHQVFGAALAELAAREIEDAVLEAQQVLVFVQVTLEVLAVEQVPAHGG
jgi:hypothetical protein